MRWVLTCLALYALIVTGPSAGSTQAQPWRTLKNERVGFSLSHPPRWKIAGKVVATQFVAAARCQSVRVVDRAGPSEVRQSIVQVCWKPITGDTSLDAYMRKTYGRRLPSFFVKTRLGGVPAYRSRTGTKNRTFFLQTNDYRMQVVAAVAAGPLRRAARVAQVNRILASFTVT
ncbi:MAG TPA: hypothetical protein VHI98_27185 [Vicinamibacterales bacterium]|nr:hypothetical protein [Vicinamibacterales bacterium]